MSSNEASRLIGRDQVLEQVMTSRLSSHEELSLQFLTQQTQGSLIAEDPKSRLRYRIEKGGKASRRQKDRDAQDGYASREAGYRLAEALEVPILRQGRVKIEGADGYATELIEGERENITAEALSAEDRLGDLAKISVFTFIINARGDNGQLMLVGDSVRNGLYVEHAAVVPSQENYPAQDLTAKSMLWNILLTQAESTGSNIFFDRDDLLNMQLDAIHSGVADSVITNASGLTSEAIAGMGAFSQITSSPDSRELVENTATEISARGAKAGKVLHFLADPSRRDTVLKALNPLKGATSDRYGNIREAEVSLWELMSEFGTLFPEEEMNVLGTHIPESRRNREEFLPFLYPGMAEILRTSAALFKYLIPDSELSPEKRLSTDEKDRLRAQAPERIYVLLDGGYIGDSLAAFGFPYAITAGLTMLGAEIPVTYVVNQSHKGLYEGLENAPHSSVISGDTLEGIVGKNKGERILLLELGSFADQDPFIEQGENWMALRNLFGPALKEFQELEEYGLMQRYGIFAEYFLGLTGVQRGVPGQDIRIPLRLVQPELPPPPDHRIIFKTMAGELGIQLDATTEVPKQKQTGIIIEASLGKKRYPLEKWAEVIRMRHGLNPDEEFNIIFNGNASAKPSYPQEEVKEFIESLNREGIIVRGVSAPLKNSAIFLSHLQMVFSNDTGLPHWVALIKDGPFIGVLYLPHFDFEWRASSREIPRTPEPGSYTPEQIMQQNNPKQDDNTVISTIPPDAIARMDQPRRAVDLVRTQIRIDMASADY